MKRRLDVLIVERGLAESREKAQALIMAGRVRIDGVPAQKPGTSIDTGRAIDVQAGPGHVGRGALKLEGALDAFALDVSGRVAVDVGASTGGFTEILLRRGVVRVYAVDVGWGQMHESLRQDPRVVLRDRVNARTLSSEHVPEPCGVATVDVSFISVAKILPALSTVLAPEGDAVVLVKPQFEVGRGQVGKGGIVSDPELHRGALRSVAAAATSGGWSCRGACASPVPGTEGNREFFLWLQPQPGSSPSALESWIVRAVGA